jgi:hypothetical protein
VTTCHGVLGTRFYLSVWQKNGTREGTLTRLTHPWTEDFGDGLGLSPRMPLRDFDGSLGEYIEALHAIYHATLYEPGLELWGLPLVAGMAEKAADGRDQQFWHLITMSPGGEEIHEKREATRQLNPRRCAYLPRVCDVLRLLAAESHLIYWWQEPHRFVLASPADFSIIVKLRRQAGAYELSAAYPTNGHRRRYIAKRALSAWATMPFVGPPGTTAPRPGVDRWAMCQ